MLWECIWAILEQYIYDFDVDFSVNSKIYMLDSIEKNKDNSIDWLIWYDCAQSETKVD